MILMLVRKTARKEATMRARSLSQIVLVTGASILLLVSIAGANAAAQPAADDIDIRVSPKVFSLGAVANCGAGVTVHADIPFADVDCATVELQGIPAVETKADDRGNLVAKFDRVEVAAIVAPPSATLTLTGSKLDGTPFTGSDTIRVVD